MKALLATGLAALALSACATPTGPGPVFPSGVQYRAIGTEPFWNLDIGRQMSFTDRGTDQTVVQPTPTPINGVAGEIYQTTRINANIVHAACSDGMSDRRYPDTVQVRVDGRDYRGCGAPADWAGWRGEGSPATPADAAPRLGGTNWRVVAINGAPTPAQNYSMNFMADGRLGAKFGCNNIGAGYSQAGNVLTIGALMQTRMACADMRFEDQGTTVLSRPVTVSGSGPQVTLTSSAGSIVLVRAG